MRNFRILLILNIFAATIIDIKSQSSSVQNVGVQYVNGHPDQIAVEQTQVLQRQKLEQSANPQQNFIIQHENQGEIIHEILSEAVAPYIYTQQEQSQNTHQQLQNVQQPQILQTGQYQNSPHIYQQSQNTQQTQIIAAGQDQNIPLAQNVQQTQSARFPPQNLPHVVEQKQSLNSQYIYQQPQNLQQAVDNGQYQSPQYVYQQGQNLYQPQVIQDQSIYHQPHNLQQPENLQQPNIPDQNQNFYQLTQTIQGGQNQIYQQLQHFQKIQANNNDPHQRGNFVQWQLPQGTQVVQNQIPVQQNNHYPQYVPQIQQHETLEVFPFGAHLPNYGVANVPPGYPAFVNPIHPPVFSSLVVDVKPVFIQQPVSPVIAVKEIVGVPVPVKVQPICTVYPFQKHIPECVLEKALFPGKYHPIPTPGPPPPKKNQSVANVKTTNSTSAPVPESRIAPVKKDSPKRKNPNDSFVVLNNSDDQDAEIKNTTEKQFSLNEEDELLIQELEREAQNQQKQ